MSSYTFTRKIAINLNRESNLGTKAIHSLECFSCSLVFLEMTERVAANEPSRVTNVARGRARSANFSKLNGAAWSKSGAEHTRRTHVVCSAVWTRFTRRLVCVCTKWEGVRVCEYSIISSGGGGGSVSRNNSQGAQLNNKHFSSRARVCLCEVCALRLYVVGGNRSHNNWAANKWVCARICIFNGSLQLRALMQAELLSRCCAAWFSIVLGTFLRAIVYGNRHWMFSL